MEERTRLPLADAPPVERADAARNRQALLEAAAELVGHCHVGGVTMEAVAQHAGVGKGTVFRRFESREGLMTALLDHTEREWQQRVMAGPPPLGPGAPPLQRLLAFGSSRIETSLQHAALIRAAGQVGTRASGAAAFSRGHVHHLLGLLEVPGDRFYLATALLAPLEIPVLEQDLALADVPLERIEAGWVDLVRRVVGPGAATP